MGWLWCYITLFTLKHLHSINVTFETIILSGYLTVHCCSSRVVEGVLFGGDRAAALLQGSDAVAHTAHRHHRLGLLGMAAFGTVAVGIGRHRAGAAY